MLELKACAITASIIGLLKRLLDGRRDGSAAKSTGCSRREPGFDSQHTHDGLKPFVTPVLGELKPSSGFLGHQALERRTDIHTRKIPKHIFKKKGGGGGFLLLQKLL